MGARTLLILTLLILGTSGARAAHDISMRHKKRPTPAVEVNYLQDLLHNCERGNGHDCDRYGRMLLSLKRPGDRELALSYVRRACVLAYLPACVKKSPHRTARWIAAVDRCGPGASRSVRLQTINIYGRGSRQMVSSIAPGSALARVGLRKGDVILSGNSEVLTQKLSVSRAFDQGRVAFQVLRPNSPLPQRVYCP